MQCDIINFSPDGQLLIDQLRLNAIPKLKDKFLSLLSEATSLAHPKICWHSVEPVFCGDYKLKLENTTFNSKVLYILTYKSINETVSRRSLYPFIATCGTELEGWSSKCEKRIEYYWANIIMQHALQAALAALEASLKKIEEESISRIEPGIAKDWPIEEQCKLFNLLTPCKSKDISINPQSILTPKYSIAGIYFFSKKIIPPCLYCSLRICSKLGNAGGRCACAASP
jgi:hypothetical protein